ncbi:M15 family metallopeptidase [Kineococcus arenarius]|uniref:M15 family metallopeptidase n=1 Tax=Kineococcus sp. SYSU DK007 TaxID=3383128 RepID=UPI003D7DC976
MPSPFAADRLPDGRRRYSHRAVVARRTLLAGVVVAGTGTGAGIGWSRSSGDRAAAGAGPAGSPDAAPPAASAEPAPAGTAAPAAPSTTDAASPWVVVNKKHPIDPADYAPAELVTVGGEEVGAVAAPDLTALLAAARADGVDLRITSGYRSREHQRAVHERAVRRDGLAVAESVSARPGHSEHQTGLAVDFGSGSEPGCGLGSCFEGTPEGRWLAERAGLFGFLLRYPAGYTEVTGYAHEPWHYRWVGRELVEQVAHRGVATLEEFFGITGGPEYA